MADPVVKAIFGDLYRAPTSAASGGTLLQGMAKGQPIVIAYDAGVALERHGLEVDAVRSYRETAPSPPRVLIPAEGGDAETLKLLWAASTSDGAQIASTGSPHVAGAHTMRECAAVIRPWDTTQPYWYFPRLQLHPDARPLMNRERLASVIAGSVLVLVAARPDDSDYPAIGMGSAAQIDSLYGLGAPPPP